MKQCAVPNLQCHFLRQCPVTSDQCQFLRQCSVSSVGLWESVQFPVSVSETVSSVGFL